MRELKVYFESLRFHCKLMRSVFLLKPENMIVHIFFDSWIIRSKFSRHLYIYMRSRHYFDKQSTQSISCFFAKKLLFYWTKNLNVNGTEKQKLCRNSIFSFQVLFYNYTGQYGKEGYLFHSTHFHPLTNVQTITYITYNFKRFVSDMNTLYFWLQPL